MSFDFESYVSLLENRLSLLRLLAQQYVDCRKDFVSMDIDRMYARIAEQEDVCRQIQALQPGIDSLQQSCAKQLGLDPRDLAGTLEDARWVERLRCVMRELGETQAEVGRLNQIHAAYLQRSRKTIHVLMNSLGLCAVSYAPRMQSAAVRGQTSEKG